MKKKSRFMKKIRATPELGMTTAGRPIGVFSNSEAWVKTSSPRGPRHQPKKRKK